MTVALAWDFIKIVSVKLSYIKQLCDKHVLWKHPKYADKKISKPISNPKSNTFNQKLFLIHKTRSLATHFVSVGG